MTYKDAFIHSERYTLEKRVGHAIYQIERLKENFRNAFAREPQWVIIPQWLLYDARELRATILVNKYDYYDSERLCGLIPCPSVAITTIQEIRVY